MNLKSISNSVTSKAGRAGLKLQKQSPAIMFGAGVVGVVGTVVLASKATLRVHEILDEHDKDLADAGLVLEDPTRQYGDTDFRNDKIKIYSRTILQITKLYAPAFVLGAASIASLTGAHVVLNRRYVGAVAAYGVVDQAFRDYRERVVAELGEEKDLEFKYGVTEREVYTEKKNGEPKVERIKTAAGLSMYAVEFDSTNENWQPNPENSLYFLRMHQNFLNNQLQARGHVFLNEVYDSLGMERTKAGAVVGWVKGHGDDCIDFGIWADDKMEQLVAFTHGSSGKLTLDFNVDGVIYDLI